MGNATARRLEKLEGELAPKRRQIIVWVDADKAIDWTKLRKEHGAAEEDTITAVSWTAADSKEVDHGRHV